MHLAHGELCPVWRVTVRPTEGPPAHSSSSTASVVARSHRKSRRNPSSRRCTGNSPPPPPAQRQLLHRQIWTLPPLESDRDKQEEKHHQQPCDTKKKQKQKSYVLVHLVVIYGLWALFKWFMERGYLHIIWGQRKAEVVKQLYLDSGCVLNQSLLDWPVHGPAPGGLLSKQQDGKTGRCVLILVDRLAPPSPNPPSHQQQQPYFAYLVFWLIVDGMQVGEVIHLQWGKY